VENERQCALSNAFFANVLIRFRRRFDHEAGTHTAVFTDVRIVCF
jgi:hypothetical protein